VTTEADRPADGSKLASRVGGAGPALTLVHGFTQTGDCWGPLAEALMATHRVTRVDAPGHGGSSRHGEADLVRGAELLAATGGSAVLLGYSMGGRLALRTAVDHPDAVRALVLVGATGGIEDPDEREARRLADDALAERMERLGVDAFLEEWLAMDMFAGLPDWARFAHERRRNTAQGLAASLRHAGTGTMTPLWDRVGELRMPVLCVTGARDERYGVLAERLVAGIGPHATHVEIAGAGHAAHLEEADATTAAIVDWLRAFEPGPGAEGRRVRR
jgi:2-succinyl-6-hydroxy-2,4-cyclohexadiene-1-carboxylate synthase